ncbi:MAG: SUMF1/EgtB/PvdO family nonheme iron enzyme [Planctomycetaceae bacterium]
MVTGSNRSNRGGSWRNSDARRFSAANRNRNTPSNRNNNLGFRLAAAPSRDRAGTDHFPVQPCL